MDIPFHEIAGLPLHGTDGTVGLIDDLLVEPGPWVVRYLVLDTGTWLPGRKVLLPPLVVGNRDWSEGYGEIALTRQQVKECPNIDTAKPVSRQMEASLFNHFNVPAYWGPVGSALAGSDSTIPLSARNPPPTTQSIANDSGATDAELRSVEAMTGYYVKASDGEIGHVKGFLIDDHAWVVRDLIVDTKNWLPAKKVLVTPQSVVSVCWGEATIDVSASRDQVKDMRRYQATDQTNTES